MEQVPSNKMILISVSSAGYMGGNFAKVTINGVPIWFDRNEHDHFRGLHLVVINPANGQVVLAKVFDTFRTCAALDELISSRRIPRGHIVVAACKEECANALSPKAKHWFKAMGSSEISQLAVGQAFALMGIAGRHQWVSERRGNLLQESVALVEVFIMNTKDYGRRLQGRLFKMSDAEHELCVV